MRKNTIIFAAACAWGKIPLRLPAQKLCVQQTVVPFAGYSVSSCAICTALVAAPLRTWSPQHQMFRPLSEVRSSRIRPTNTVSWSLVSRGMGYFLFFRSSTSRQPGAHRRRSTEIFSLVRTTMDTLWLRTTGTRTQVQLTFSSGRCIILRPSFCIFISSEV